MCRPLFLRAPLASVAARLGTSVERAAMGVIGIVSANMVRAIRTISVERGYDPRGFTLMPFGGAGPLHGREIAVELGVAPMSLCDHVPDRSPGGPDLRCGNGEAGRSAAQAGR